MYMKIINTVLCMVNGNSKDFICLDCLIENSFLKGCIFYVQKMLNSTVDTLH